MANFDSSTVSVINTHSNRVTATISLGAPQPPASIVPSMSAIAIAPDGRTAYVAEPGSNSIVVIDTETNQVVAPPIAVGTDPSAIAIAPDGGTAYVANFGSSTVSTIDTGSDRVVGSPIDIEGSSSLVPLGIGANPSAIAIAPDGSTAYVANRSTPTVSVIDTSTNRVVGTAIVVHSGQSAIAIAGNGSTAYATNYADDTVSVSAIDTGTHRVSGSRISGSSFPSAISISPNGKTAFVADYISNSISTLDVQRDKVVGRPIKVGARPSAIAIVPDQPPIASFRRSAAQPKVPVAFDASASHDPDGSIARYKWTFGDGSKARTNTPAAHHIYRNPGSYRVTLEVIDKEGCSSSMIFTGQTASCNGSARAATETHTVNVVRQP